MFSGISTNRGGSSLPMFVGRRCLSGYLKICAFFLLLCLLFVLLTNIFLPEFLDLKGRPSLVATSSFSSENITAPILNNSPKHGLRNSTSSSEILQDLRLAMRHSWLAYKKYAWGMDEVLIISKRGSVWMNASLTLIDSLDTLWIYDMKEEFNEARNWIMDNVDFTYNSNHVNLFESTIRLLGGLLSAFHLSGDRLFLDKASVLGNKLLKAFESTSGIPFSDINLATGTGSWPLHSDSASLSEIATIQLEFNELALLLKDGKAAKSAAKVSVLLHKLPKMDGLLPIFLNNVNLSPKRPETITLGARGDSYYEYLLKLWVQTGKRVDWLASDYRVAISGVVKHLLRNSSPNSLSFIGELIGGRFSPKMDHLVCFLPGTLAYGYLHGMPLSHLKLAKRLLRTCVQMYKKTATGLSPEIVFFNMAKNKNGDFYIKPADAFNLLRPETVESLFYLYQITKEPVYRVWGREIFLAFQKYSRMPEAGYASMSGINSISPIPLDKMHSFWIAETLKYFYLLFSDEAAEKINLKNWVFNSEAHPFPLSKESELDILTPLYSQSP